MIHISNLNKEVMETERKRKYIAEALEEVSADIVNLIYRIVFHAQSGME